MAAAAYRAGLLLREDRTGVSHDYSRRAGVADFKMIVPQGAPNWGGRVEQLFNAAEAAETRINSRVARELLVALPCELDFGQRRALSHALGQLLVDRYQVGVMAALHEPPKGGDARNHHCHLLMTTRVLDEKGLGAKVRILDDKKTGPEEVAILRSLVADLTNAHLQRAGLAVRVDSRTWSEQAGGAAARGDLDRVVALSRIPGRHLGPSATAAVRRGLPVAKAMFNRTVEGDNAALKQHGQVLATAFKAQMAKKMGQERAELVVSAVPTLAISTMQVQRLNRGATRAGRLPTMRGTIGDAQIGIRAVGKDARLLNSQGTLTQKDLRASRDINRLYLAELNRVSLQIQDDVERYVALWALTPQDGVMLLQGLSTGPSNAVYLRKALDAHEAVRRCRLPSSSSQPTGAKPPPLPVASLRAFPRSRREWAEYRRAQRRALIADFRQGSTASGITEELKKARATWWAAEMVRRRKLPLPTDGRLALENLQTYDENAYRLRPKLDVSNALRPRPSF